MNSEELEVSLRTEFESYLKDVFAEMRQEVSELQQKLNDQLDRHKTELSSTFETALSKFDEGREVDPGFRDSVIEHLRLSKDEGARITAAAIAEAEELERNDKIAEYSAASADEIFEAVSDISSKESQAEILKSLVNHAEKFAPRGAFFIVKNNYLGGWRVIGSEDEGLVEKVREISLPVSEAGSLGQAVTSLETVASSSNNFEEDAGFLTPLGYGEPRQRIAVPLVARGRGVAVLYADGGEDGTKVNKSAIETLVRVASLTVELLANAKSSVKKEAVKETVSTPAFVSNQESSYAPSYQASETQASETESSYDSAYQTSEPYQTSEAASSAALFDKQSDNYDTQPNNFDVQPTQNFETQSNNFDTQPVNNFDAQSVTGVDYLSQSGQTGAAVQPVVSEDKAEDKAEEYVYNDSITYIEPLEETPQEVNASDAEENLPSSYNEQSFVTPPFYDPAPSIAPSVVEQAPEEAEVSDSFKAEDYAESTSQTAFDNAEEYSSKVETPAYENTETPVYENAEESKYGEIVYPTEFQEEPRQNELDANYGAVETQNTVIEPQVEQLSAEEFAENFARTSDPSDYSKDLSYGSETLPQETKDFSYASNDLYQSQPQTETVYPEPETLRSDSFKSEENFQTDSFKSEDKTEESFQSNFETFTPTKEQTYTSFETPAEPVQEDSIASTENDTISVLPGRKSRLSERNVDLPIEVSEGERRLHNDARRFARLLVSEIKLYNEQKVKEGRESNDLYDRLREAIDRSREMYDKRVQPAVASKFDYFHYELVNTLAEGTESKLGSDYPGTTVH